jgi:diketogulonate reductase-like aldo/keto reductase
MNFSFVYGTAWKKENTRSLVKLALENGFVAFDTANQLKHYDEALVGEAILEGFKHGIARENLFLQTKFTSVDGQDERLPYNKNSKISVQVAQSLESSLEHLHCDYVDSYLLHGPYHYPGLGDEDWEVWSAIEKIHQQGKAKKIGLSNVNHLQLAEFLKKASTQPMVVQNRCFAQTGWDYHVRKLCEAHGIMYQGFSLLTANPFVLKLPEVITMAEKFNATPAQIVFAFAIQSHIFPLTGTRDKQHMKEDLAALHISLGREEMEFILQCGLEK